MKTIKLQAENPQDIARAGEILRKGGLVGIPTETVYGLAADALNGEAVKKIFQAKGRPMDNPLIVHISHIEQLQDLVAEIPESARELARRSPHRGCAPTLGKSWSGGRATSAGPVPGRVPGFPPPGLAVVL